ncbi:MAG: hypothetical protein ACJ77W_12165, partial [Chloroflexota bacterium]
DGHHRPQRRRKAAIDERSKRNVITKLRALDQRRFRRSVDDRPGDVLRQSGMVDGVHARDDSARVLTVDFSVTFAMLSSSVADDLSGIGGIELRA